MSAARRRWFWGIAAVVVVASIFAAIPLKIEYDIRPYLMTMSAARLQAAEIIQRGKLDDIAKGIGEPKSLVAASLSHDHLDVKGRMLVVDDVRTDLKVMGSDGQAYSPLLAVYLRSEGRDRMPHTTNDVVALVTFVRNDQAWFMERCECVEQFGRRSDYLGKLTPAP